MEGSLNKSHFWKQTKIIIIYPFILTKFSFPFLALENDLL